MPVKPRDVTQLQSLEDYFYCIRDSSEFYASTAVELAEVRWRFPRTKQSLLFFAAARTQESGGAETLCRRLARRHVDLQARDVWGQTPLFYAAREGNTSCCEFLVELGMDVNLRDKDGATALFYAIEQLRVETAVSLLKRGASLGLVDSFRQSAYSIAAPQMLKALEKAFPQWSEAESRKNFRDSKRQRTSSESVAAGPRALASWAQTAPLDPMDMEGVVVESDTYAVIAPKMSSVAAIRQLEKEFVKDHADLFAGELFTFATSPKDWCDAVSVRHADSTATRVIKNLVDKRDGHFVLAALGKSSRQIAGYVHAYLDRKAATLFIGHLKVTAEHQRRGVGRLLVDSAALQGQAEGWQFKKLALHVIEKNLKACRFYENLGFHGKAVEVQNGESAASVSDLYKYIRFEKQMSKTGQ
ncbi:unnamed protein product [Effrenium voratum]|nr:unnamed protein product [Effrenium voratum]